MALLTLPFLVLSSVNTAKPANLGVSPSSDTEVATTTDLSQILQELQSLKLELKNRDHNLTNYGQAVGLK